MYIEHALKFLRGGEPCRYRAWRIVDKITTYVVDIDLRKAVYRSDWPIDHDYRRFVRMTLDGSRNPSEWKFDARFLSTDPEAAADDWHVSPNEDD